MFQHWFLPDLSDGQQRLLDKHWRITVTGNCLSKNVHFLPASTPSPKPTCKFCPYKGFMIAKGVPIIKRSSLQRAGDERTNHYQEKLKLLQPELWNKADNVVSSGRAAKRIT